MSNCGGNDSSDQADDVDFRRASEDDADESSSLLVTEKSGDVVLQAVQTPLECRLRSRIQNAKLGWRASGGPAYGALWRPHGPSRGPSGPDGTMAAPSDPA